ncbi:MAG: baseplate J/gp47 family protein [Ktedonobacteraceae bacterium]|nr:baseplate J/gp47 family protein [Ktedonobacteraceae bacterium]
MDEHLHEEINGILTQLHERYEQQEHAVPEQDEVADTPDEQPSLPPKVYVYVLDRPLEEHLAEQDEMVESTPTAEQAADPVTQPPVRNKRKPHVLLVVGCLALVGVLAGMLVALLLVPPTATITLVPVSTPISSTLLVTVVTGTPTLAHHEVQGRLLSSLVMSQASTVPTTGTGTQQARAAQGIITFYNAALTEQVIPAGTLLTGTDGVEVVTEQEAAIPAGSLSTNGQATVPAHATESGPTGNIKAGDLYGPCCRANVFVQNSAAFTGGQDARTFPMVTQQDLDQAATTLKAALASSVQAAVQAQVHPGEHVISPLPCTPMVTPDHRAGAEASQVTVTVSESCTAETYDAAAIQTLLTQSTTQQATTQLGAGYALTGELETSILHSSIQDAQRGVVTLEVKGAGLWSYQFTNAQLDQMKQAIAGTSKAEATALLLHTPGVRSVSVSLAGTSVLPRALDALRVVVVYGV